MVGRWVQKPWIQHLDDKHHLVVRQGIYASAAGVDYTIPEGFITDGGSVPRALWWWMPPFGDDAECAYLLHDYLYKHAETFEAMTRLEADDLLHEAAIVAGYRAARARVVWLGVRAGGWVPWRRYRKANADAVSGL